MPTRKTNPLALGVLQASDWQQIEGQDVGKLYEATSAAMEKIRAGKWTGVFLGEDGAALQSHQFRRSKTLPQPGRIRGAWKNLIRSSAGKID